MDLPDDALLEVLMRLDARELLRARGVCRRWREMALHPHLWRRLRADGSLALAALRLAPCLDTLALDLDLRCLDGLLLPCPVRRLELVVHEQFQDAAVALLRHQARLGRLSSFRGKVDVSCERFMSALVGTELQELELYFHEVGAPVSDKPQPPPLIDLPPVKPSLKTLSYQGCAWGWPPMEFFLKTHGATLESITLLGSEWPPNSAALIAKLCPELRALSCPPLRQMDRLPRLSALHLLPGSARHLPAARDLLLRAARLTRVTLDVAESGWLGALLHALRRPGAVRSLRVHLHLPPGEEAQADQRQAQRLMEAILELPRLECLELGGLPRGWADVLLRAALAKDSAPAPLPLRRLHALPRDGERPGPVLWCGAVCVMPRLRELQRRLPGLRVSGIATHLYCSAPGPRKP